MGATAAVPVSAQEPLGYAVNARVRPGRGIVEGAMHVAVAVPEDARGVRLWVYADRLAVAPAALDEINARWIYPGRLDRGHIEVTDVRVDGRPVHARPRFGAPGTPRGRDVAGRDLWVPVPPGRSQVGIRLRFRIRLPSRFGRLGRVGDVLHLAAPWYPLVVDARGAHDFRAPHRVRVRIAGDAQGLLGGERFRGQRQVRTGGPYVPLLVAPELHERRVTVRGVPLRLVSPEPTYRAPDPQARGLESLHDLVRIDPVAHLATQLGHVLRTWRMLGLPPPEEPVLAVSIASRTELTAVAPGWTLLSDRLYQVFPLEAVRQFHHRAVRHALFRSLLERMDLPEPPRDRPVGADLRAALLVDLDEARRDRQARTPQEIIGWAGFHPLVDQLLYAPQIPFEDVYFDGLGDGDPFRDAPGWSRRPRARGRRVLEMARDALGPERTAGLARRLLALDQPFRRAVAAEAPALAERLPAWLAAPALPVNYRLGAIDSSRVHAGYRHRVEIVREGADRTEPVEVALEDEDGHRVVRRWAGEGARGWVTAITPAPLDEVTLDPRHRLVQSPELAGGHPRGDDATDHPWRPPILRAVAVTANVSEGRVVGLVDFVMRRRYELDHALGARLDSDARSTGGLLRYVRDFGPRRHTNDRIAFFSAGIGLDRLHAGFRTDGEGGWRTALRLSAGVDTHRYYVDPRTGRYLTGSVRLGLVRQDDGDLEPTWASHLRAGLSLPFGLRHVLRLVGGLAYTGGDALPGERPGLGGQSLLRGYESDERVGRGRAFAVIEHRWTALSDLALNALHLAWVRQVQLALFAGGGAVVETLEGERLAFGAEVGGGVRFHFDYAGVQPGVLAIDVGVPLVRDAQERAARPPVGVRVGFDQFF